MLQDLSDIAKKKLGPCMYEQQNIQVLEKSQKEVYKDFKDLNPDLKVSATTSKMLKLYYVQPATSVQRKTCCCRYCVEAKLLNLML